MIIMVTFLRCLFRRVAHALSRRFPSKRDKRISSGRLEGHSETYKRKVRSRVIATHRVEGVDLADLTAEDIRALRRFVQAELARRMQLAGVGGASALPMVTVSDGQGLVFFCLPYLNQIVFVLMFFASFVAPNPLTTHRSTGHQRVAAARVVLHIYVTYLSTPLGMRLVGLMTALYAPCCNQSFETLICLFLTTCLQPACCSISSCCHRYSLSDPTLRLSMSA